MILLASFHIPLLAYGGMNLTVDFEQWTCKCQSCDIKNHGTNIHRNRAELPWVKNNKKTKKFPPQIVCYAIRLRFKDCIILESALRSSPSKGCGGPSAHSPSAFEIWSGSSWYVIFRLVVEDPAYTNAQPHKQTGGQMYG